MTVLAPMDDAAFAAFAAESVNSFAEDNVLAGRWLREEALERAQAGFAQLLPQGRRTPNHEFFTIRESEAGEAIGHVWFAVVGPGSERRGFLYDVMLAPEHRGRGHAMRVLELLDRHALDLGLATIGLHVFGFNTRAQALYRAAGYGVTGLQMQKRLRRDDA
jgi:RimJ/RimL family protein N-acetyltransferase